MLFEKWIQSSVRMNKASDEALLTKKTGKILPVG